MKTKTNNKLNILLPAITLLLLFVIGFNSFGKTNSWLVDKDIIGFQVEVGAINVMLKQGEREIANGGFVYLGTDAIEADTNYLTDTRKTENGVTTGTDNTVVITNEEETVGYYLRFQAIAMVNGVAYNINNCITGSDFVNREVDGAWWMYSVADKYAQTPVNAAIAGSATLTLMKDINFPQSFVDTVQGQYFKLYLYIEGSANGEFV